MSGQLMRLRKQGHSPTDSNPRHRLLTSPKSEMSELVLHWLRAFATFLHTRANYAQRRQARASRVVVPPRGPCALLAHASVESMAAWPRRAAGASAR